MQSLAPSRVCNLLVRGTNWAGDTVISLPAARQLRRIFSQARITFWTPENLAPLVAYAGVCDDVIAIPTNQRDPLTRSFRMARQLAARPFDMVVLFQNAFESAFTSWLAGIPVRAGYPTDLRGPFLNLKIPLPKNIRSAHQVFYYLGITEFIESLWQGTDLTKQDVPDCRIQFRAEDVEAALALIASVGGTSKAPWFCLCPGSANSEAKRWPPDYFAKLADALTEKLSAQVIFCGAPSEALLIEKIMSMQKRSGAINLAAKTGMLGMMGVMSLAQMVVSNDTGSAHLAAAASARVLTLFGPTSPGATAPLGATSYTIQGAAPCAPCRHFKCPKPDHPCMRNLTPATVFDKIEALLTQEDSCSRSRP
ncbi:MAG: lipopolysaccharide heptosyltransferase II [Desulfomonilaceae bacterium]